MTAHTLSESVMEDACLAWLEIAGWHIWSGAEPACACTHADRRSDAPLLVEPNRAVYGTIGEPV